MLQRIKKFIVVGVVGLTMLAPALAPSLASVVAADAITSSLCTGTNAATGGNSNCNSNDNQAQNSLKTLAAKVVNLFSIVVGIVAVIMIIVGGFKYITSGGDSGNVTGAKQTLIYAIVGLIIVALAQFVVHFVIGTAVNTGLNTSS